MDIVVLGLTITSSWGNGHATTYRALLRALSRRGHQVIFLERDKPWYRDHRDMPSPPFCDTILYQNLGQLKREHTRAIRRADLVVVGSYVPEGIEVGRWVCSNASATAFYDIDTPVTLRKLAAGGCEYLAPELIPCYDLYFSFTGGGTLDRLEQVYGSPRARALYCSVDPTNYYPEGVESEYDLGYMGTYLADRQPALQGLLVEPAQLWPSGRFVVAGPQYPGSIRWPANVTRIEHLAPSDHRRFYNKQRFTLNVTRADMREAGYSPSVRLFEAAACGTPIITDSWPGLDTIFDPQEEILVSHSPGQTLSYLRDMDEHHRRAVAHKARQRVLGNYTADHRAAEFEQHAYGLLGLSRKTVEVGFAENL
ncbi:MAG: glycosyltransferase [Planctomycetaceae bacterium]|nr:MAG: glycosyltransferase [Planctomycetaceae bacterium]